ncbi:MAG: gamma-glutamyl-gamma-aminobutyrate hydrolase family protein [Crocinitomicaceae bacterium]|nr:gamma-glutamyl-gamma-aminobutyrate hydrolase family protein [Crocinitomicaceae bacterium]
MIYILDCGSKKTRFIHQMVDQYMDCETVPFFDFDESNIAAATGIIISGAPILVTEEDMGSYITASEWIKTISIPLLGICFGHQLIGIHYGSIVKKMKEDREFQEIEIFEESKLFARLPRIIEMQEDHCEFISVPNGFKQLASSDYCFHEAMEHKEKPIYGIQFHPEVSGNHGNIIIENFLKICV